MKIKYRIIQKYNPCCGTWYIIQYKRLFIWHTLESLVFSSGDTALNYLFHTNPKDFKLERSVDKVENINGIKVQIML